LGGGGGICMQLWHVGFSERQEHVNKGGRRIIILSLFHFALHQNSLLPPFFCPQLSLVL